MESANELNDVAFYQQAASDIRILHEGEESNEYRTAQEYIRDADVIYLLGFGYHPTNVRRLDIKAQILASSTDHPGRVVRGTAYGMGDAEREDALTRLGLGPILFHEHALAFLRAHGPLH
jgi:hypothetical protein